MSNLPLPAAGSQTRLVTDWALHTKVPGQKMDYEVRLASMDAGAAERCIRSVLAGTPAGPAKGRPEALPWYGFAGRLGERPVFAIMEVSWSTERDATRQPITPTRLLVTGYEGAAQERLTYTRLAEAMVDLRWRGVHDGPPGAVGREPFSVQPRPADLDAEAASVRQFGVDLVGGVAALVLDGAPVVFTTAEDRYPPVAERIRLFDAVCALLPYAYRHHVSAATWASHRAPHDISLTFAARAGTGQVEVLLDNPVAPRLQTDEARAYVKVLLGLLKKERTVEDIVHHLAQQTDVGLCRNAADAVGLLQRMDMPGLVAEAIADGRARLADVEEVLNRFGFEGLDDEATRRLYCTYLLDAIGLGGSEAGKARAVLAGAWSPLLVDLVADRLYAELPADRQMVRDRLVALLDRLPPDVAKQVVRRFTVAVAQRPRPEDIAAHAGALGKLSPVVGSDEEVHRTFLAHPAAGVHVVSQMLNLGGLGLMLHQWRPLVPAGRSHWARPLIAAAHGALDAVTADDFAALEAQWPNSAAVVASIAARNNQLVPLLRSHAEVVARVALLARPPGDADLRKAFQKQIKDLMAGLRADASHVKPSESADHGRLDVVLMAAGSRPPGLTSVKRLSNEFLSGARELWVARVLDPIRPALIDQLRATLLERSRELHTNADVYDVMAVVDWIEPTLRETFVGRVSAYLAAHPDQRSKLQLGREWAALIDPWLRRLMDLAAVCENRSSTTAQVVGALRTLLEFNVVDYGQVSAQLQPWLTPDRAADAVELVWLFEKSPQPEHRKFGRSLRETIMDPAGPLHEVGPYVVGRAYVLHAQAQLLMPSAERYPLDPAWFASFCAQYGLGHPRRRTLVDRVLRRGRPSGDGQREDGGRR